MFYVVCDVRFIFFSLIMHGTCYELCHLLHPNKVGVVGGVRVGVGG